MTLKVKSKKFMGPYIAVHGGMPKNELPKRMRRIPKKDIWIRSDDYRNKKRRERVLAHEHREINYMNKGMKYKPAHRKANRMGHRFPHHHKG